MRGPNGLMALLAGVMVMALPPLDDATAEQKRTDPAARSHAKEAARNEIDRKYDLAISWQSQGNCKNFEKLKRDVQRFTEDEFVVIFIRSKYEAVYLPPDDRGLIRHHARQRLASLRRLDCPPKGQAVTAASGVEIRTVDWSDFWGVVTGKAVTISVGGGPGFVDQSRVTAGTKVLAPGDEGPTAKSDGTLTGQSANVLLQAPVGPNLRAFLGFNGSWFDGSSGGETDGDAANTYIDRNPVNDSTGVGFPGGQVAAINSEGRIIDVTAGVSGTIFNFGGPPPLHTPGVMELAGDIVIPAPGGVAVVASAGFRYRNLSQLHSSFSEALLFIDDPITAQTNLDLESNFFGGQVGAGVILRAPNPDSGLFGGVFGTAAFGGTETDATALGKYRCVACGAASPEFDFALKRNFDESNFSAIYGGEAFLGVSTGNVEFRVFVTVEHMTNVPAFSPLFTPAQQPIHLVDGDLTNATFGARVTITDLGAATAPSDARLKRDIVRVGRLANGLPLYRYRYLWSDIEYVGVMAQEAALLKPEAVARGEDGFFRVDYGRLGTRLMTFAEWSAMQ